MKIAISPTSTARRGWRASASVTTGAPIITPTAYALTSNPAAGIDTWTPAAITGSRPIGENSVVPMPNAPHASASNVSQARCGASGREDRIMMRDAITGRA